LIDSQDRIEAFHLKEIEELAVAFA